MARIDRTSSKELGQSLISYPLPSTAIVNEPMPSTIGATVICRGPTAPPIRDYDVFLNHRGPDVKKGFVSHLGACLESVGVSTFVDYKDLHVGEDNWDAIESAIHHSKIHVAIFSPGYAESEWCLKEIHEILKCRTNGLSLLFVPVFFKVSPADLRFSESLKSCYFEAFKKHLNRNDPDVVQNWRNALFQASLVSGWPLDDAAQGGLRWLEWRSCPWKSLSRKLDLSKVAVLDLTCSRISSLSNGHVFENLRELILYECINITGKNLPDFRVSCKKLEMLDLSCCYNLESVPDSIGCLSSSLTHLKLVCCEKLTRLPDGLARLTSLKSLKLEYCEKLERLPEGIGQLTALEGNLNLAGLESLVVLPESVGNLTNLSSLQLKESKKLKELPSTIGNLKKLTSLVVEECSSIREIPQGASSLTNLVSLKVRYCESLSHLPSSIGQLGVLATLDFSFCNINDGGLPEELCNLSSLRELSLDYNYHLSGLPKRIHLLPNLGTLGLRSCWNLREIPRLPPSLRRLVAGFCLHLIRLPSLSCVRELRTLNLQECRGLQELVGLDSLSHLEELNMRGCKGLSNDVFQLQLQLASLTSLRTLDASGGTGISVGPYIGKLVSLEEVILDGDKLPEGLSRYKREVVGSDGINNPLQPNVSSQLSCIIDSGDKQCKGVVFCSASRNDSTWQLSAVVAGRLTVLNKQGRYIMDDGARLCIRIYRATTHASVGMLKGGDSLRLEASDIRGRFRSEVVLRVIYEDHELEEMWREL